MSELKPCPFCGGTGMYVTYQQSVYIRCRKCNSTSDDYKTTEEAENAWNKRPNPWHSGIPTEEGWYLLHLRRKDKPYCVAYMDGHHWLGIDDFYIFVDDVLAWQKIEPYRG